VAWSRRFIIPAGYGECWPPPVPPVGVGGPVTPRRKAACSPLDSPHQGGADRTDRLVPGGNLRRRLHRPFRRADRACYAREGGSPQHVMVADRGHVENIRPTPSRPGTKVGSRSRGAWTLRPRAGRSSPTEGGNPDAADLDPRLRANGQPADLAARASQTQPTTRHTAARHWGRHPCPRWRRATMTQH